MELSNHQWIVQWWRLWEHTWSPWAETDSMSTSCGGSSSKSIHSGSKKFGRSCSPSIRSSWSSWWASPSSGSSSSSLGKVVGASAGLAEVATVEVVIFFVPDDLVWTIPKKSSVWFLSSSEFTGSGSNDGLPCQIEWRSSYQGKLLTTDSSGSGTYQYLEWFARSKSYNAWWRFRNSGWPGMIPTPVCLNHPWHFW